MLPGSISRLPQVDQVWTGHVHLYSRTCPIFHKTCMGFNSDGSAAGPVHINMGHAGYELTWISDPQPPSYFESVMLRHGYTKVVANATHFYLQSISSEDGALLDEFVLTKPANYTPNLAARKQALAAFQPPIVRIGVVSPAVHQHTHRSLDIGGPTASRQAPCRPTCFWARCTRRSPATHPPCRPWSTATSRCWRTQTLVRLSDLYQDLHVPPAQVTRWPTLRRSCARFGSSSPMLRLSKRRRAIRHSQRPTCSSSLFPCLTT